MKMTILTLAGLLMLFSNILYGQADLKEMEAYAKIAKPGWDKIDVAIGLGRLHTTIYDLEKGKEHIANLHKYAKLYNIPSAKSYALILENLIAYLHENDADKAIRLCKEAMQIARGTNNKDALVYAGYQLAENYIFEKGEIERGKDTLLYMLDVMDESVSLKNQAHVIKNLGFALGQLGKYDESLEYLQRALSILEGIIESPPIDLKINRVSSQLHKPIQHVGFTLGLISDTYLKKGDTQLAIEYAKKSLEAAIKSDLETDIAFSQYNLGTLYNNIGKYQEAIVSLQEGEILFEKLGFDSDLADCKTTLSSIFINLKDYDIAAKYVNENLNYHKEADHMLNYSRSLLQMINIQLLKDDVPQAIKFYNVAEPLIDEMENKESKATLMQLKGKIALNKGNISDAEEALKSAVNIYTELKDEFSIADSKYMLAQFFFTESKYDSALYYGKLALNNSKNLDKLKLTQDCYKLLSQIHEKEGDFRKALENYKTFFSYNDSIYTVDAQAKLKEEQVRQDVEGFKKEKELAEQNARLLSERNQLYLIAGIIMLFILIGIGFLYTKLVSAKAQLQEQNLQLVKLNQTRDKFFGIIAHDLRSPLLGLQSVGNQIDYFIKKGQTEQLQNLSGHIENTTKRITELLDNLLSWALLQNGLIPYQPDKVNLQTEASEVVALLEPMATMKNIKIDNNILDTSFVFADSKSVNTILRNLISNAIKYTPSGGSIKLNVSTKDGQSFITINDNGTGISGEQLPRLFKLDKKSQRGTQGEKGTGLGLILCKELVELNKGTIKVMSDLGKGSSFTFNLPNAA